MKTVRTTAEIFVVMIFLFSFAADLLNAQEVIYTDSWGKQFYSNSKWSKHLTPENRFPY